MNSIRCRISLLFSLLYIVALISAQNGVLNLDLSLPPSIYSIDQRSQRDIYVAFYESSSVKKLCDVQVALYSQGLIPCVVRRGDLASFNTASGNAQLRAVFYVKSTGRIIESRPMTVNLGESPYQSRSQSILSAALSPIKNLITAVLIGLSTAHAQLVNGLLTIAGSLSGAATAVLRASAVSIGSTASVTILAAFLTLGPKPGFGRGGASSGSTSRPISTIRGSFSGFKLNLPVLTIKADTPKTLSSTKNDKLSLTNTSTSVRTEQPKESNLAIKKSVRSMLSRGATVVAAGLITVALMMLSKPSERERVEQRPKSVFKLLPKPQPQSQPQLKSPVRQQVIPTSVAVKKKEGKILKATPQKVIIKSVPVKPTMKESKKAQPVKSMVKQQVLRIIPVKSEPTTKVANTRVTAIISKTPVKKVDKTVAPVKANKPVSKPPQQVKRVFGTQKQTSNLYDFSKTGSTTKTVPSTIRGSAIATAGKTIKPVVIKQASKSKLAVQVPENELTAHLLHSVRLSCIHS